MIRLIGHSFIAPLWHHPQPPLPPKSTSRLDEWLVHSWSKLWRSFSELSGLHSPCFLVVLQDESTPLQSVPHSQNSSPTPLHLAAISWGPVIYLHPYLFTPQPSDQSKFTLSPLCLPSVFILFHIPSQMRFPRHQFICLAQISSSTLSLSLSLSAHFTFSLLLSFPIVAVPCLGQSNPSDFNNQIIQSEPTQQTGADPEGQTNQLRDRIRPPTCLSFRKSHRRRSCLCT